MLSKRSPNYPQDYQQGHPRRVAGHRMKPVESNVSPYLQQPLRTLDEVRQERERRQRELAAAMSASNQNTPPAPAAGQPAPAAATPAPGTAPAATKALVDQTA